MMYNDPDKFKYLVKQTLLRHYKAIDTLANNGLVFWDYGNAFLLEVSRASENDSCANINSSSHSTRFKYPSYMQDVMGDIFSLGFGPFRWICTSGDDEDLKQTDLAAQHCFEQILESNECE
jgi:urocanate hydratase